MSNLFERVWVGLVLVASTGLGAAFTYALSLAVHKSAGGAGG